MSFYNSETRKKIQKRATETKKISFQKKYEKASVLQGTVVVHEGRYEASNVFSVRLSYASMTNPMQYPDLLTV